MTRRPYSTRLAAEKDQMIQYLIERLGDATTIADITSAKNAADRSGAMHGNDRKNAFRAAVKAARARVEGVTP